jgi:RNA polymerase sigma-70 factor (ECF subfamily)
MTEHQDPRPINDADTRLVNAIQAGRHDLFEELVRRYERVLYNYGLKLCGLSDDAEDLVQDTFLNVFKYLKNFRHETKFKNWLYRVATSACLKKKRRSKFAPEREISLDDFLPDEESALSMDLPRWATQPLEQVLDEELGEVIRQALMALPEKYRLVIVLRDVEGFSTQEAAEILELTPTNIKVRLHRARLFLREALKTYYETD